MYHDDNQHCYGYSPGFFQEAGECFIAMTEPSSKYRIQTGESD